MPGSSTFYPVSTVTDGQGLNITVQSYLDMLDFGLVSCRGLVPDLWHVLDLCLEEVQLLDEVTRGREAEVTAKPKRTRKRPAASKAS